MAYYDDDGMGAGIGMVGGWAMAKAMDASGVRTAQAQANTARRRLADANRGRQILRSGLAETAGRAKALQEALADRESDIDILLARLGVANERISHLTSENSALSGRLDQAIGMLKMAYPD